nr:hypothetical protein [Methylobacterium thuringiense]
MRIAAIGALAVLSISVAGQAEAKGCIKGAIVGGIAGHYAGHGVVGAMGGCVAGRALAKRADRKAATPDPVPSRGAPSARSGSGGYVAY